MKKCKSCLAHYTKTHECDGLMKHLVEANKELGKSWEKQLKDMLYCFDYGHWERVKVFVRNAISQQIQDAIKQERQRLAKILDGKGYIDYEDLEV